MKRTLIVLAAVALVLATPLSTFAAPAPEPASQPIPPAVEKRYYVELEVGEAAEAAALAALIPEWEEAIQAGATRVILTQSQIDLLRQAGFSAIVVGSAPDAPTAWPSCYNRLSTLYAWLINYAEEHPTLLEVIDYGDSWCKQNGGCTTPNSFQWPGDDLLVVRVTNENAAGPKTGRFFTDPGIHARELPTLELAKTFVETLVNGYGVDPDITLLLDQREIYVALTSNPDGRRMVELGTGTEPPYTGNPWYWRKNARTDTPGAFSCSWPPTSGSHYGIDLNRNHIFKWDASGGSTYVCNETYRGATPGSEPEIQAYENFVRSIIPDQRPPGDNDPAPLDTTGILINLHNVVLGGVILVPWGWTTTPAPNNTQLQAIAQKMSTYNGYGVQNSLYPVSGNTRDWAYGELGIPAYVIELDGDDFFTDCSLVPGIINNMLPVLKYAARIADRPYRRAFGPDARNVAASPASVASGASFTLTAQINDTQNGNQAVNAAEYVLVRMAGATPGDPGTGTVMAPADGAFNSTVENATATVSTAGLGRGRYLALVRGRDIGSNWGPFFAQKVEVTCYFADINCSGQVDVTDIVMAAEGVGANWTSGAYDYVYDVDNNGVGDGNLDVVDVQLIASDFGWTAP